MEMQLTSGLYDVYHGDRHDHDCVVVAVCPWFLLFLPRSLSSIDDM
jgi:hypothetical protein